MKLNKVKLKHKTTGVIIKVNEDEWARDLGQGNRFGGYERVGETNSGRAEDVVNIPSEGIDLTPDEPLEDEVPTTTDASVSDETEAGATESKPRRSSSSRRGRHSSDN